MHEQQSSVRREEQLLIPWSLHCDPAWFEKAYDGGSCGGHSKDV